MFNSITDIPGIKVGHATDLTGRTGCTVILCEEGAVAGIDVRGSASGTRQVDALNVGHIVEKVHAILLCGGSSFGLDAASGVSRYLEEKGDGFDVGIARITRPVSTPAKRSPKEAWAPGRERSSASFSRSPAP